jgi:pilus assembly protein Flp/PilA
MIKYLKIQLDAKRAKMEERGASAVEYGLLIAGIAALIVIAVFALGPIIREAFDTTCDTIASNDNNTTTTADCADGS